MTSPDFSTVAPRVSATPRDDIDKKLARLVANKDAWLKVGTAERAELLQQCIVQTKKTAKDWVRAACQAKGIDMKSPRAGEEWLGGPMATIRNLRLFREAMLAGGEPPLPGMRTTVSGLRRKVGLQRILAVFEPRSNTMKLGTMKAQLPWALEEADLSFCLQGNYGWSAHDALAPLGPLAMVADSVDALVAQVVKAARPGDHVLCMSNGGFGGVHARLLDALKARAG